VDNYFWLRDKKNPEVKAYLDAENAYTDTVMKPTEALQKKLYDEMLSRIKETDVEVPYKEGGYFYYVRTEAGKQYPIRCRKKGSMDAPEEVILDVNELAKGQAFMSRRQSPCLHDGQHRLPAIHSGRERFAHGKSSAGPCRTRRLHRLGQRQQNHFLHGRRCNDQAGISDVSPHR
jgi:protease II